MKFNVGYQLLEDESLIDGIIAHKDDVYEVYFSFGDSPVQRLCWFFFVFCKIDLQELSKQLMLS